MLVKCFDIWEYTVHSLHQRSQYVKIFTSSSSRIMNFVLKSTVFSVLGFLCAGLPARCVRAGLVIVVKSVIVKLFTQI